MILVDEIAVSESVRTVKYRSAAGFQVMNDKPVWLTENIGKNLKENVTKQVSAVRLELQRWEESVRQRRAGNVILEEDKKITYVGASLVVVILESSKLTVFKELGGMMIPNVIADGVQVQLSFTSQGAPSIKRYHIGTDWKV